MPRVRSSTTSNLSRSSLGCVTRWEPANRALLANTMPFLIAGSIHGCSPQVDTSMAGMLADSPSVLKMAMPLVISFWMRAAFALVDTIYAAHIGDSAVASVGLTIPYEYLMIALWIGLSTAPKQRSLRSL